MRSPVAVGALLAVAAALAGAGCGGGRTAPPPRHEPPAPAPLPSVARKAERYLSDQLTHTRRGSAIVPAGYRVRRLNDAGFAVAFPAGWQLLQYRDAVWPGVIPSLARINRGVGRYLTALVAPDSPLKLVGFDRRTMRGPLATATVLVSTQRLSSVYAEWSAEVLRQLRATTGLHRLGGRRLAIPAAGDALLVEYRRGGAGTLELFALRGTSIYVLTLRSPAKTLRSYRPMFLRVARSLDLSVPILHP